MQAMRSESSFTLSASLSLPFMTNTVRTTTVDPTVPKTLLNSVQSITSTPISQLVNCGPM